MLRKMAAMLLGLAVLPVAAEAQDRALDDVLGRGVHAYFGNDPYKAHELLTATIKSGSQDPRAYYFRGLSYLQLGRRHEAEGDFQAGARFESGAASGMYGVSTSLERIQGAPRMMIERYRSSARLAAYQERERLRYERYERIRRMEPQILVNPADAASPAATQPATPPPPADQPPADQPPAGQPPAEPPSTPSSDPFSVPAAPSTGAPSTGAPPTDPFGT